MKRTQLGQNLAAFLLENQTAPNKQFGASGGVARPTPCVGQHPPLSSKPYQYPRLPPSRRALPASFGRHFTGFLECVTSCRIGLRKNEN